MGTILVLAHERDRFDHRHFLVKSLLPHWREMGHVVLTHEGTSRPPEADAAILHVDCTLVPDEYVAAVRSYRVPINAATRDIGKRAVSEELVQPFDSWSGPVIVKTNANAGGLPEILHAQVALERGEVPGPRARYVAKRYPIYESIHAVPVALRFDPELVVEKFLPERDPRGYATRHWIFLGDRGWCTRIVSPHPIVKGADAVDRAYVDVPEAIRAHRQRLGFDFGKFDFVIHDGRAVLIDANRTPTVPAKLSDRMRADLAELALGIDCFVGPARPTGVIPSS